MSTRISLERIGQDWKRILPDLEPNPMLPFIAFQRIARLLQSALESGYAASGLNSAGFDLLLTLYRSSPPEGFTPTDLAKHMAVTPASVTNRIDRLLELGLVRRELSSEDRRSLRIHLAPAGQNLVNTYLPLHLENERRLLGVLSPEEQAALEEILRKFLIVLESSES